MRRLEFDRAHWGEGESRSNQPGPVPGMPLHPPGSWEALAGAARYDPRELAKLSGVSLRTLQRRFQRRRLRLSSWLRDLLLATAYRRLAGGELVKFVAYDLGYRHLSNFSRDFRRRFGVPPSVFSARFRWDG